MTVTMYTLHCSEEKEQAYLARHRKYAEERKARIYNFKNRTIGIDVSALEKQAEERRNRIKQEREQEKAYLQELLERDASAIASEERRKERQREKQRQLIEYYKNFQRPEMRVNWDIQDPNANKKEKPLDIPPDGSYPISSMQSFAGDNLEMKALKKKKQNQIKTWADEQLQEKYRRQREKTPERSVHLSFEEQLIQSDERKQQLKQDRNKYLAEYNRKMALDQAKFRMQEKIWENEDNALEIHNIRQGDFFAESPRLSKGNGLKEELPNRWKGYGPNKRMDLRLSLDSQVADIKKRRELERQKEEVLERMMEKKKKEDEISETSRREKAYRESQIIHLENQKLALQQIRREALMRSMYLGEPDTEYLASWSYGER